MHDKILLITAACYLVAVIFLYLAVAGLSDRKRVVAVAFTLLGVLFHTWAEAQHWLIPATPQVSLLNVMSLCALATVAIPLATYPMKNSLFDANLAALPISVLILVGEGLIQAPILEITEQSAGMVVHIITSIVAFGVLSIAGVYAIFITTIDHLLRQHNFNSLIQTLPALETLEEMLMHLIKSGFVVLTLSLATGLIFVEDLFGQHLGHKTILSITAWMVFAALLWGHWKRGWRGRVAVRMTLAGIVILLLSYFGSKLVLEIILERSWHI
ncbi:MAG: cytochrome c biogenesis protein CcsA [Xanthomonadales bacterium]|nr:cytochrome c biogenesis protein CcsA [Xanthomonadales bacterium]